VGPPERFEVPLEEALAAAPHHGGVALGGARRLGGAGEGGKEHGGKGSKDFPEACVIYVVREPGEEGVIACIYVNLDPFGRVYHGVASAMLERGAV
jgi:hypothetical protein